MKKRTGARTRNALPWVVLVGCLTGVAASAAPVDTQRRLEAIVGDDPLAHASVDSTGDFTVEFFSRTSPEEFSAVLAATPLRHFGFLRGSAHEGPLSNSVVVSKSYYLQMEAADGAPGELHRMVAVADRILQEDDGTWGLPRTPPEREPFPTPIAFAAGIATLGALLLFLVRRPSFVSWDLRPSHLLPSLIQAFLLLYWSVYWPGVHAHLSSLLLQVLLAYAVDAVGTLLWFRHWKIGAGPLPIALSVNLFTWCSPLPAILLIVLGVSSRLLFRRGGRHIFNPSALALSVVGLLAYVIPVLRCEGIVVQFLLPPNMAELLLIAALIPQLRFRIALVSVGAYMGLSAAHLFFYDTPSVVYPATLLALTLLATDPATTPVTPQGKLLFGIFVGFGMGLSATLLNMTVIDDGLGKIIPIPVAAVALDRSRRRPRYILVRPPRTAGHPLKDAASVEESPSGTTRGDVASCEEGTW